MKRIFFLLFYFILLWHSANCQLLYYQDTWKGGVTGAGFSTGLGAGTGVFNIYIEPGSTIRKAFLLNYTQGFPSEGFVKLNNQIFKFDKNDQAICVNSPNHPYATPVCVNIKDITLYINPLVTNYQAEIPVNDYGHINWGYWSLYLVVLYDNPAMPETNFVMLLNDKDLTGNVNYNPSGLSPVNTTYPVGFAIYSDRGGCSWGPNKFFFNTNLLGSICGDSSLNNCYGCGTQAHFYYQNNALYGLDDDVANNSMNGGDALADVSAYLNNNATNCTFQIIHNNYPNLGINTALHNLAYFLAYTSPCDTFSAAVNYQCLGDTFQLQASGGIAYEWLPQQNLSCYNCPNPIYLGNKSTTYTCRIWNSDSCSKVLPITLYMPKPDSISLTPGTCGDNNSSLQLLFNANYPFAPLAFNLNSQTNNTGLFTQLDQGYYTYKISDSKGCSYYDTVFVNTNIKTKAIAKTSIDKENPFLYFFTSQSQHADYFKWIIQPPDTTIELENISYLFEQSGDYKICLEAYYKKTDCKDIHCFRLSVKDSAIVIAPNVFTPNGDNKNDVFALYIKGIKQAEINIYNRWGEPVHSKILSIENQTEYKKHIVIWDGIHTSTKSMCSSGVYYWTLNATDNNGNAVTKSGNVQLLE